MAIPGPAEVHSLEAIGRAAGSNRFHRYLQTNDASVLRTNALLRRDEWIAVDTTLVETAAAVLAGVADLQSRGLTLNLGGLGVMISQYEKIGDMSDADVDMAADAPGEEDRVVFEIEGVPVPIIHKDFRLTIRQLEASRRNGGGLDTTNVAVATRKVTEKMEDMLFNGSAIIVRGYNIYGYRTHPDRNTGTGGDWGTATNIHANIRTMIQTLQADGFYGPFVLYLNAAQDADLNALTTSTERMWRTLVMELPTLQAIRITDKMPATEAVMVNMSRDVVDWASGMDITPVQWNDYGGMVEYFKVMTAGVPRVKSTADGKCGIYHMTGI